MVPCRTARIVLVILLCSAFLIAGSNSQKNETIKESKKLVVDFLYLNLMLCERCKATDNVLDEALVELKEDLRNVKELTIRKIKIETEDEAKNYNLIKSPTIRINGKDIEEILTGTLDIKDNYCQTCAASCGNSRCRTFKYKGETYDAIPKEMIIEAIRKILGITSVAENNYTDSAQPSCCPSTKSCGEKIEK